MVCFCAEAGQPNLIFDGTHGQWVCSGKRQCHCPSSVLTSTLVEAVWGSPWTVGPSSALGKRATWHFLEGERQCHFEALLSCFHSYHAGSYSDCRFMVPLMGLWSHHRVMVLMHRFLELLILSLRLCLVIVTILMTMSWYLVLLIFVSLVT